MTLENVDYSALYFSSENVWKYLKTGRWSNEDQRDMHVILLAERLQSALDGAFYRALDMGYLDSVGREDFEYYRILMEVLPRLEGLDALALRAEVTPYIDTLRKLLTDQPLNDSETKSLFTLCMGLNILSATKDSRVALAA